MTAWLISGLSSSAVTRSSSRLQWADRLSTSGAALGVWAGAHTAYTVNTMPESRAAPQPAFRCMVVRSLGVANTVTLRSGAGNVRQRP